MIKKNKDKIVSIISKILNIKKNNLQENPSTKNTPKWDSINHIKIIIEIEKKFNKKFSTSEYSKLDSLKNILKYLSK